MIVQHKLYFNHIDRLIPLPTKKGATFIFLIEYNKYDNFQVRNNLHDAIRDGVLQKEFKNAYHIQHVAVIIHESDLKIENVVYWNTLKKSKKQKLMCL